MISKSTKELAIKAVFKATQCRNRNDIPKIAPIDPIELSKMCGCEVWFLSLSSLEGMHEHENKRIIIGSQRSSGRCNYTCAHELGHYEFKHGAKFDEFGQESKKPEEFLADTFASHLLMPQLAVVSTIKKRNWNIAKLTEEQAYILASYFGVGYSTIINHLNWSLGLINNNKTDELLQTVPKEIKEKYDTLPSQEVVFCDTFWLHRAVNLEVGDTLILPIDISIDHSEQIKLHTQIEKKGIWKALVPGYAHASSDSSEWAINIRVSQKNYEGLADYRFKNEPKENS